MLVPLLTCLVFYLLVFALSVWRPNAGRIFLGFFFLAMAWGVNGFFLLQDASAYVPMGELMFIPEMGALFTRLVGAHPTFWVLMLIIWETTVGLLILSRGARVKVGLTMGIIFLLGITPFNQATLANPVLALVLQYLITKDFPQSIRSVRRAAA